MPTRSTRKVNIYKWHRMKKKIISSVISVLCCLVVMMVGVYASTTDAYQVSISNDIDLKIVAVDGTLYARRRGGVWANPEGSESAYGNAVTEASSFEGQYYENLQKIYDIQNNIDTLELERLCQKIDINVYHNEIEYVFKYVIDRGNINDDYLGDGRVFKTTTKLTIINGDDGDIKPNQSSRYECSYKYYFGNSEPRNWDLITGEFNVDGKNYILAGDEDGRRVVYIRAYLKFNTEEYGNQYSDNGAEAAQGLGFKGKWQFTLALEELEGTIKQNASGPEDERVPDDPQFPDDDDPITPGGGGSNPSDPDEPEDEFVYEISADGKYVYMGEYPQTIKANNVSIVSATPDSDGYYLGSDGERY